MINQFSETIKTLKQLQFTLPLEQTIDVGRNSLLPLVYQYYGHLDKLDKIGAEGVTKEMINLTEIKIKAWDIVVSKNTLEEGTEDEINHAYILLKDPTIYAYAFFKVRTHSK